MRTLIFLAVGLTLASAFGLYAINYDTWLIESEVSEKQRQIEAARNDIAVLKAERAHLARPERIAPLARDLGLEPMRNGQLGGTLGGAETGAGSSLQAGRQ